MSKKTTTRKADNSSSGQKKKKFIQTKLDVHFSFGQSSMNEKDAGPSISSKDIEREKRAAAALSRATANQNASENPGSSNSCVIDITDSPADQNQDQQPEDKGASNKDTAPKRHFWDNVEEEEDEPDESVEETPDYPAHSESPDDMNITFLGTPLEALRKSLRPLGKLVAERGKHTILFDTSTLRNIDQGQPPRPYPRRYCDRWDADHIRMPCSSHSEYPVSETDLVKRWELVQEALSATWKSFDDLKASILSYNERYADKWSFNGLQRYIEEMEDEEREALFSDTLPKTAQLALQLPEIVTQPIPILKRGMRQMITMTQQQAACILANAFFCTFPRRNQRRAGSEYGNYPEINFNRLFGSGRILKAKLDFIFHYFRRITERMPEGVLSFERFSVDALPDWSTSPAALTRLHVSRKGTIEDFGEGMLQVDFANKFLGGGVLGHGAVQEEIRFLICPEMIVPMLFAEALADDECFVMTGCERFSYYTGYASTLEWLQPYQDTTPRDEWGRRRVEVVAIDALPFSNGFKQFRKDEIERELNKAYCGFVRPGIEQKYLGAVATGNWGCGAFRGDKELKCIIQLMAAAEAGRDVAYFTFDDGVLMRRISEIYELLLKRNSTIASIHESLLKYSDYVKSSSKKPMSLFEFLLQSRDDHENDD